MPVLKSYEKFKTISLVSIIISAIYLLASVVSLLLVFSYVSGTDQTIAMYSLTRTIQYGRFFQRTDAIFILIWILLVLSYLSIITALCLNIFKKISNTSTTKPMVFPFIILIYSASFFSHNIAISKFIHETIYRYFELILVYILSFFILIVANIKLLKKKGSTS